MRITCERLVDTKPNATNVNEFCLTASLKHTNILRAREKNWLDAMLVFAPGYQAKLIWRQQASKSAIFFFTSWSRASPLGMLERFSGQNHMSGN